MAYTVKDLEDVAKRLEEYRQRVSSYVNESWKAHPVFTPAAKEIENEQVVIPPR